MLAAELQERTTQLFTVELSSPDTTIPWDEKDVWAILHTVLRSTSTRVVKVKEEES